MWFSSATRHNRQRLKKLKARKINVKPYTFSVEIEAQDGTIKNKTFTYNVIKSIENIVLANNPQQTTQLLSHQEALRIDKIMDKFRHADGCAVHLEEAEFQTIRQRFSEFRGFGVHDIELCRRIEDAEQVDMEEKPKK